MTGGAAAESLLGCRAHSTALVRQRQLADMSMKSLVESSLALLPDLTSGIQRKYLDQLLIGAGDAMLRRSRRLPHDVKNVWHR